MEQIPTLIQDLALILLIAAVVSLLFKWLKQPVVLGYIVAGFIPRRYMTRAVSTFGHKSVS
jgi:CPA2 family monovalent cation:H+ antiporter-2